MYLAVLNVVCSYLSEKQKYTTLKFNSTVLLVCEPDS